MVSLAKKLAIVVAVLVVAWLLVSSLRTFSPDAPLLGARETVTLVAPKGDVDVIAKIDTGADYSSVDEKLALALGIESSGTMNVVTADGSRVRPTARVTFSLGGRRIETRVTLADRSNLSTVMLVGKNDLEGFLVDASRDFLSAPQGKEPGLAPFFTDGLDEVRLEKFIIIIPILGAVVVLLRLLVGLRTYGVFAPVVIGLTLVHLGLIPGMVTYLVLLVIGIGAQILLLTRLKLPHIAQSSLIMFTLVATLGVISVLPIGISPSFGGAFFPLIITSHLIEQASQNIEEHRLGDMLRVLTITLGVATLLGAAGIYLLGVSTNLLWAVFGLSLVAAIGAGHYLGLRLTEIFRFKFLKRNHVHK